MKLPQELINSVVDAIVDDVDLSQTPWIITSTVVAAHVSGVRETLRCCALAARAFVRPCQMYLLYGVILSYDHVEAFSALCLTSPHLASYVRALSFAYRTEKHLESIMDILAILTNLTRLEIYPGGEGYPASLAAALALPYLRRIGLRNFHFDNAPELQTLLSGSRSLQTLVLDAISFGTNTKPTLQITAPASPRVVLDSLRIIKMDATQVQAVLDAFTVIDITRLRTLDLIVTPMKPLLKLNAPTLKHLKIRQYQVYPPGPSLEDTVDADGLARAHQLQSLDFGVDSLSTLNKMLRLFGSLESLTRLQTVRVNVSQKVNPPEWRVLDGLLGALPALVEAHVYASSLWRGEPDAEALLRQWMPVLAARNVLRIHAPAAV
ncbi:hypothetical protein DFH09DRAFT_1176365 [Mycena vulgaris]|nr:hypothetical protein DFH09DRAFT_1176365 [Mycena vulgaris]